MSAREAMLANIRFALKDEAPPAPAAPAYRHAGDMSPEARRDRFLERLDDYNVHITRLTSEAEIPAAVVARLAANGAARYLAPADLPVAWRPDGVEALDDGDAAPLPHATLNAIPSVLTGCALAIAETGTVVLDGGPRQGRRALTLLPDHHICVVFETQLVEIVPQALQALQAAVQAGQPLTFFSGPSATADIEFERVVGVHGPRRLDVLFIQGA